MCASETSPSPCARFFFFFFPPFKLSPSSNQWTPVRPLLGAIPGRLRSPHTQHCRWNFIDWEACFVGGGGCRSNGNANLNGLPPPPPFLLILRLPRQRQLSLCTASSSGGICPYHILITAGPSVIIDILPWTWPLCNGGRRDDATVHVRLP